ncbi:hypothetical protein F4803DRAFT_306266 [Xylaria telfairii]|nr:hypothetical protein F4803DRAFT_306266 [Xylaria telfairii]
MGYNWGMAKRSCKKGPASGFFRTLDSGQTVSSLLGGDNTFQDGSCLDGPSLYQRLYPRIENMQDWNGMGPEHDKYLNLYRPRAWVFLDDARLFKSDGEGLHFPADHVVFSDIRFNDLIGPRLRINLLSRNLRAAEWTPREESRHLSQLLSLQEASTVRRA